MVLGGSKHVLNEPFTYYEVRVLFLMKSPYYRPWFFSEKEEFSKMPNFDEKPLL